MINQLSMQPHLMRVVTLVFFILTTWYTQALAAERQNHLLIENNLADVLVEWPQSVTRFALGSCAKERLPQPIWDTIAAQSPELFLFIGDNHYADLWAPEGGEVRMTPVTDPKRFYEAYQTLSDIPEFAAFRQHVPIMATWDDHDYGANDQGKDYPLKQQSQRAFLDFFQFPADSPIHQQAGIYHAKTFGPLGQKVQFIMLDTRYHRDAIDRNPNGSADSKGPFIATQDTSRSMLGEQQWQWLETQLKQPADIRFIISSVQFVAYQHGWETWGNMPHERDRLYALIGNTRANGVIILSGDRHLTEISVDTGQLGATPPYPIWDFTASGMTDKYYPVTEENTFRVGGVYRQSHFGTVDIEWADENHSTQVVLKAIDEQSRVLNTQTIAMSTLRVNKHEQ